MDAVRAVADDRGVTMPQVALAWLADRPAVSSVILGARTVEQLDDNLGAAGLPTAEETARLDAVSDPGAADYPYGDVATEQRSRAASGDGSRTHRCHPACRGQRSRGVRRSAGLRPSSRSSSAMTCRTALIRARWVNAWGKLPRCWPLCGSISSA